MPPSVYIVFQGGWQTRSSQEVRNVNECACGAARRKFWIWEDSNGVLHASSFQPSASSVRAMIAATARDALLPIGEKRAPKHQVHDAEDMTVGWEGRCSTTLTAAAS